MVDMRYADHSEQQVLNMKITSSSVEPQEAIVP